MTAPRLGRIDTYPREGYFTTAAMAEGAIDGSAETYQVTGPFDTHFAFSRFDAPYETSLRPELILAQQPSQVARDAAATD